MTAVLQISGLGKTYKSGHVALSDVDLSINKGEIFALLGPNGAGKTTLISIVCGIVTASAGTVTVAGHDHARDYRAARTMIGLVPQELHTDAFETVLATVSFSRGFPNNPRGKLTVASTVSKASVCSSCGTSPIIVRAAR